MPMKTPHTTSRTLITRLALGLVAVASLIVLGLQIARLYFVTDDAFISFRYARNLVEGHGLVYNIGERVEGYSNFLWTIWSAVGHFFGAEPVLWANVSSILLTAVLLLLVVRVARNHMTATVDPWLVAVLAIVYLGVDRSFAVWATGGLETRLSTLLLFAAIATSPLFYPDRSRLRLSSLLFGLAILTRMEAYLFFGLTTVLVVALPRGFRSWRWRDYADWLLPFAIIAAAHLIFRLLYYGYPVPNTAYAKVTGANFAMGWKYLLAFFLEYHLWLLAPLIVIGLVAKQKDADDWIHARPLLPVFLMFLPYLFYLAYIGGDHFEFRQLDPILPFLALAIGSGTAAVVGWLRRPVARVAAAAALIALVVAATTVIPWLGAKGMPDRYQVASTPTIDPADYPALRAIPGYARYLRLYNDTYHDLTWHLDAIRAEEHRFFLAKVRQQAQLLNNYLDSGLIDRKASLSLICIGAIPYYTRLETIDYNGLTDTHVAHSAPSVTHNFGRRLIAHEKNADWAYLMQRHVDYIFSIGWGFFTDEFPLPITQPDSYIVHLPDRWMAFRTAMSEADVRAKFGQYPIWYRAKNNAVRQITAGTTAPADVS